MSIDGLYPNKNSHILVGVSQPFFPLNIPLILFESVRLSTHKNPQIFLNSVELSPQKTISFFLDSIGFSLYWV